MNLFWLHADWRTCVFLYSDVHTYKMLLEATQLMSNAYTYYGGTGVYKPTHRHHPCAIWTAQSARHFRHVGMLARHLAMEYHRRYHRVHKCWSKVMYMLAHPPAFRLEGRPAFLETTVLATMGDFDDVPLCMDAKYHHRLATVAYRRYYMHKILRVPRCQQWMQRKRCPGHARALLHGAA